MLIRILRNASLLAAAFAIAGAIMLAAVSTGSTSPASTSNGVVVVKSAYGMDETIQRLKSLLQQRLTDLETQIGALGEAASAASSERDIRAMNTLVRTLEKVLELERKDRAQRGKQRKLHRGFDDAEREALADKLDALRREHADSPAVEAHEPPPVADAEP